jgi:Uma2 family endonuclease
METIARIPKTALEVFRLLPEGTLCEDIDNVLYMSPAPLLEHQRMVGLFYRTIFKHLELSNTGEIFVSPVDVYFEVFQSVVQPDVVVVMNENKNILEKDGIHGSPDLIIEVLSGDTKRDLVEKKSLYERAGVTEYFIVNPDSRQVTSWLLQHGAYFQQYNEAGKFKSKVLNFSFEF